MQVGEAARQKRHGAWRSLAQRLKTPQYQPSTFKRSFEASRTDVWRSLVVPCVLTSATVPRCLEALRCRKIACCRSAGGEEQPALSEPPERLETQATQTPAQDRRSAAALRREGKIGQAFVWQHSHMPHRAVMEEVRKSKTQTSFSDMKASESKAEKRD